mgnify:CR=1 FL=1
MTHQYVSYSKFGDLDTLKVSHPSCTAEISLFGGHLLSFAPTDQDEILWLSQSAKLDGSKPIRGGVPLCWPWFGPGKGENAGLAQHGFARTSLWQLDSVSETEQQVELLLSPRLDEAQRTSNSLSLQLKFVLSSSMEIQMISKNAGNKPVALSQAIHTYFKLEDVNQAKLLGIHGCQYFDQLTTKNQTQESDVTISGACDRIYLCDNPSLTLVDGPRQIEIEGQGHDSVVVWNPWQQGAESMIDFDDLGYKQMICVEMANTQGLVLQPGESHFLSQTFYRK